MTLGATMAGLYFLAILGIAVVFVFKNGVAFALSFLGTAIIPCVAIAGMKWGLMKGDRQQRIGVPIVALLLLAFAYWLSTGVSVQVFGHNLSGLTLGIIGSVIGLIGIPLSWADTSSNAN